MFQLVFKGECTPGTDPATARSNARTLFKATVDQIERMFSGQPVVIRNKLEEVQAEKYRAVLQKHGMVAYVQPMEGAVASAAERAAPAAQPQAEPKPAPATPPAGAAGTPIDQQGFIATLCRVAIGGNLQRRNKPLRAITPADNSHPHTLFLQTLNQGDNNRCLAGPTHCDIAHHNDGYRRSISRH